jgi:hypothetical protein
MVNVRRELNKELSEKKPDNLVTTLTTGATDLTKDVVRRITGVRPKTPNIRSFPRGTKPTIVINTQKPSSLLNQKQIFFMGGREI